MSDNLARSIATENKRIIKEYDALIARSNFVIGCVIAIYAGVALGLILAAVVSYSQGGEMCMGGLSDCREAQP